MISLGKHSSRRNTLRARNSLWSQKTVNFSTKSNVLVNQKLKPRPEVFLQFCHLANVVRPRRDWTLPVWNHRSNANYAISRALHYNKNISPGMAANKISDKIGEINKMFKLSSSLGRHQEISALVDLLIFARKFTTFGA